MKRERKIKAMMMEARTTTIFIFGRRSLEESKMMWRLVMMMYLVFGRMTD